MPVAQSAVVRQPTHRPPVLSQWGAAGVVHCASTTQLVHWRVAGSQKVRGPVHPWSSSHCAHKPSSHDVPGVAQSEPVAQVRTHDRVKATHFDPAAQS
ncbi:MAG: hypothetical protein ABUS79_27960 [Pseudomonadota bacterium]